MNNLQIYSINPLVVIRKLEQCSINNYVNNRESDWAFSHLPVIPLLFEETINKRNDWTPDYLVKFLYQVWSDNKPDCFEELLKEKGVEVARMQLKSRAEKLVLDFCRELHTFGLLSMNMFFDHVFYEKVSDLSMNLDYSASLVDNPTEIGVQASMRYNWNDSTYDKWKQNRRNAKKENREFEGPLFYLTNKEVKHSICQNTGVWLFNQKHIDSLIETIRIEIGNDLDVELIGINAKPD